MLDRWEGEGRREGSWRMMGAGVEVGEKEG